MIYLKKLESGQGFEILKIDNLEEIEIIWEQVLKGFSKCFKLKNPSKEDMINIHKKKNMENIFSNLSVFKRTLDKYSAAEIMKSKWLKTLTTKINMYPSDPYRLGYPCFTWRLVRPGTKNDFRNVHRDQWFRIALKGSKHPNCIPGPKIIDSELPPQLQTIKVWLALNVEPGKSGLLVSPESQTKEKPGFKIIKKDNLVKPLVNESELVDIKFIHASTKPGSFVLFGEQLMHGGAPTRTETSRISLEFELSSKKQTIYKNFSS